MPTTSGIISSITFERGMMSNEEEEGRSRERRRK
jgi:hypothetical protein